MGCPEWHTSPLSVWWQASGFLGTSLIRPLLVHLEQPFLALDFELLAAAAAAAAAAAN